MGNLIVAGTNQVWLIDHSHCFTGPNWQAQHLQANQPYQNQLANFYIPDLTLPQRVALKDKAGDMSASFAAVNASAAMHSSGVDQLLNPTDLNALSNFLETRVAHLLEIMAARVGIPSLGGL